MLVGFQTTQMVIYCIGWSPWSKPENETERTMGNPLWNMIYVAFPYLMLTPQKNDPYHNKTPQIWRERTNILLQ